MAHAPLLRNNTAPVFQSANGVGGFSSSTMNAPRASQLSGSTAFTGSSASLASLSIASTAVPPTSNGGPIVATSNIINQKADASRSLYHLCVALKARLAQVPDFGRHLEQLDPYDPVESLWDLFRAGYPLLDIYNVLQPAEPLEVNNVPDAKKTKLSLFKFVQACLKDLGISSADCFVINDVMGNDTTGFVKVTQVVNHVLDLAEQRGLLLQAQPNVESEPSTEPGSKLSYRDYIIKELVDTERKYVQDLENLHDLKCSLETKGIIAGDTIHQIFLNINAILDFQRRFLIRIETTNSMPPHAQQWGLPFLTYEESFDIYRPFIANQRKAAQVANLVFEQIRTASHPVAVDYNTLDGFLLKPMQRLVKYPLLLKDLMKKSDDPGAKADLVAGIESAERVLTKANEEVNRDMLDEALEDLRNRVDDWKNHKVEQFGKLLHHGVYTVVTGKSEQEKDYEIYLFECILLCCKEVNPNKSKDKKDKTRSTGPRIRNRNARLQLKGRIFMTNVTDVVSLSKPGSYSVQIWWRGDPGVENFTFKFTNEETLKKWAAGLENQRKLNNLPKTATTPDTANDFAWTREHKLENPYIGQQEEEDDEELGPTSAPAQFPPPPSSQRLPRNASSSSLRQRSATNDSTNSLAGMVRAPPPRFPLPQPPAPLSLQTQLPPGQSSPGLRGGDSYFSPIAESPASSRTSTASIMAAVGYPFPKQGTPQGWEEHNRYTAPAMPRAPSRDGPSPNPNGRNPRGPSLPAMASNSQSAAQQQRSRSYSTPDIHPLPNTRRHPSVPSIPAVPGIPAHLHPAHDNNLPRSQTGSPRLNETPVRSSTQSPGAQRERQYGHQHSGSYGGTMTHFPSQPIYPRQGTPTQGHSGERNLSMDATATSHRANTPSLGSGSQMNALASPVLPMPTLLKVEVNCVDSGNYVTLVVAFNITYQSLIDRIDAKLARFTNSSIGKGGLKLRYRDEDGDFVTIQSDDDIQIAFLEWREDARNMYPGGVGEIELFCVGDTSSNALA